MRIMDVKQFIDTQYKRTNKQHVSHYTRFLDKHVDFVTYFHINKTDTTTSVGNFNVDSYIGKDSPVRYNKINNMPIFGFPLFNTDSDYSEETAGFNGEGFSGEITMLPDIIEPSEGDCFILDMYDVNRFFIVTEVRQTVLKNKPHYQLSFIMAIPDYLNQLKHQITDEYNAIFDNIGTQDQVIISSKDYETKFEYERVYKFLKEYYQAMFFNKRTTMFELGIDVGLSDPSRTMLYVDKYCTKFMKDNRIVILDEYLKDNLCVDYNIPEKRSDFFTYRSSLYWAIENRNISEMGDFNYIIMEKLDTPFSLLFHQYDSKDRSVYVTKAYSESVMYNNCDYSDLSNKFDFRQIKNRVLTNDYHISEKPVDEVISIIVRYFNSKSPIQPGYFKTLRIDEMSITDQYMLIPIIMYIIRYNIHSLTRLNNII